MSENTGLKIFVINETTGTIGQTSVIRFDDNQSVGKYYQKRLFFLADTPSLTASVLCDDNTIFLYDLSDTTKTELSDIKTPTLSCTGKEQKYLSDTGFYLYYINLGSGSDTIGDSNAILTLSSGDKKYNFTVNATFWGDREENRILLHNSGVDIPSDVSRALYGTDVRDTAPDYLLLNRKYKELLMEYMNIIGNKGSYESLQKSLDWFGYNDLLSLKEFWSDPAKTKLYEKDLTTIYSDALEEIVSMYTKSTFIAINYDLNILKRDNNDTVIYDTDEGEVTVPLLDETLTGFAVDDMMLKMTLLGNYYSTFFMPLHLNLLYSTVVNTVFTMPAKIKLHKGEETLINIYKYNITDNSEIQDTYWIGDVTAAAIETTPAATVSGDGKIGVLPAADVLGDDTYVGDVFSDRFTNNATIGLGVIVPLTYVSDTDGIVSVVASLDGTAVKTPVTFIKDSSQYKCKLYIFVGTPGDKTLTIQFIDNTGYISSFIYKFNVVEPVSNHFNFNVLKRKPYAEVKLYTTVATIEDSTLSSLSWRDIDTDYDDRYDYTEASCNWVSGVKRLSSEYLVVYDADGKIIAGDDKSYYESNILDWLNKNYPETFLLIYRATSNGRCVYLVNLTDDTTKNFKLGIKNKKYSDIAADDRFAEYRFIPFLWTDNPDGYLTDVTTPVQLIPDDVYVYSIGSGKGSWVITNDRTGEIKEIFSTVSPIIDTTDKKGTYSASLRVKYSDAVTTHTRRHIWRVK